MDKCSNSNSPGKCIVCQDVLAKYCCPKCDRRTCSLVCVKQHKKNFDCDGVRCKTAFVGMREFNEHHLLSDYRFLEDVGRSINNAARDTVNKRKRMKQREKQLQRAAKRHGINLQLLPCGMTKRKENTSYANISRNCIFWKVRLMFKDSDAEYIEDRIPEETTVGDILKKYTDKDVAGPLERIRLRKYIEADKKSIKVNMQSLGNTSTHSQVKNTSIDISNSLREFLCGQTIIEHPTFEITVVETEDKNDGDHA